MDIGGILKAVDSKEGTWVEFRDGAEICLNVLTPERLRKINDQCTKTKFRRGREETKLDSEKFNEIMADEAIVNWKNIKVNGKDLPCNKENKLMLMNKWTEFNTFVQDASSNISDYLDDQRTQAEKN